MFVLKGPKPGLFLDCLCEVSCIVANARKQTRDSSAQEGHPDKV